MDDRVMSDSELSCIERTWKSDEMLTKVETNWKSFEKCCDQLGDRAPAVKQMIEHFADRAVVAPASSRIEYHNAFPGGFVDHSLRVMRLTIDLATVYKLKVAKDSLIISSIFHDWGKVGNLNEDYYLRQDSDWHRKRGQMYVNNRNIKMNNAQLGLYNMSQFGIKLSEDEYSAILLNDGQYVEANKSWAMKEPALALLVHHADRMACQMEKHRTSLLDSDALRF